LKFLKRLSLRQYLDTAGGERPWYDGPKVQGEFNGGQARMESRISNHAKHHDYPFTQRHWGVNKHLSATGMDVCGQKKKGGAIGEKRGEAKVDLEVGGKSLILQEKLFGGPLLLKNKRD